MSRIFKKLLINANYKCFAPNTYNTQLYTLHFSIDWGLIKEEINKYNFSIKSNHYYHYYYFLTKLNIYVHSIEYDGNKFSVIRINSYKHNAII